ncbi:kinase-like protein [Lentinus tigrinus ALCF2SS1-7]|uniref:Kinase-like protein n=1 Tax=Lentinus tigrinus ALCF2SS1-6 TaxID=1328759 RepID=A0A5C2RUI4_9APHY|nr:kinase-like protein [Lentinus tigrinus ALCF2SS1-6]RPD71341.1 kinase-like protein [Lentinus tigrinus ALCF2SS1-7]
MSLLQQICASLVFAPTTASRDASYRAAALTGHIGATGSTLYNSNRVYGIGILIAASIGLGPRLGSSSRPVDILRSSNTPETPTAASSSLPVTPEIPQGNTGKNVLIEPLEESADYETQNAHEYIKRWMSNVRKAGSLAVDATCSRSLHNPSRAFPSPEPRRFADASVQTEDVPAARSVPSLVPTEHNSPAGSVNDASAHTTSDTYVKTVPNSPNAAEINAPSPHDQQEEGWTSIPLNEATDVQGPRATLPDTLQNQETARTYPDTVEISLAAIPADLYNINRARHADIVVHNDIEYYIHGMLGEGSYGRVFHAFTSEGKNLALKTVHKPKCYQYRGQAEYLLAERNCMALAAEMGLPFWTGLNAAWEDKHNVYFAMDLCTGTLRDRMAGDEQRSQQEIRLLCAEMLLAVYDLYRAKIVHADIKPENFLVRPDGRVVLSDFGLASFAQRSMSFEEFTQWRTNPGGTAGYMAPAVISERYCSHYTDVYSLGMVFIELMTGLHHPVWDVTVVPKDYPGGEAAWFSESGGQQQRWLMENVEFSKVDMSALPPYAMDLCRQMIDAPNGRPLTAAQLLTHPYFKGLDLRHVYDGHISHEYTPQYSEITMSPSKRDLTFGAWHRGQEGSVEYASDSIFARVVNSRGEVVYSRWILENDAVREQMQTPLPNFEWPVPAAAQSMLCRIPAARRSPLPAPSGFPRTPGRRPQARPPTHPPSAPPPQADPLYPPGIPHPPVHQPAAASHPVDDIPP